CWPLKPWPYYASMAVRHGVSKADSLNGGLRASRFKPLPATVPQPESLARPRPLPPRGGERVVAFMAVSFPFGGVNPHPPFGGAKLSSGWMVDNLDRMVG